MARRCNLTGIGAQSGNRVSHSNRKSRRSFIANIQPVSLMSDALGRLVRLKITAATIRTVDHNGGLDEYLLTTSNLKLTDEAVRLKRQIKKAKAKKAA